MTQICLHFVIYSNGVSLLNIVELKFEPSLQILKRPFQKCFIYSLNMLYSNTDDIITMCGT